MSENLLKNSLSPYLLQHADNPVNWYPWGEEAFERARKEDKPIFLSIGYAACHWCHVMERESFTNQAIARYLNEHFISIKVDREEHPDVDDVYMTAVQMLAGSGGWPLSVFLTPDRKPFFGGTYFPPEDYYGRPGFANVLQQVLAAFKTEREKIERGVAQIMKGMESLNGNRLDPDSYSYELFEEAVRQVKSNYDPFQGGFGPAPKFPPTGQVDILLRDYSLNGDDEARKMAENTLQRMGRGGIFDQIGGGFHRYSTDAEWLVPHFEKILYDNALLTHNYLEMYLIAKDNFYSDIARRTLDWVLSEMVDENGGFYSSLDADSEGEEGKFYVWKKSEIEAVLTPEDAEIFCKSMDVSEKGNFEPGKSIPHLSMNSAGVAKELGLTEDTLFSKLNKIKQTLSQARAKRVGPQTDDKVLADWNGLMIAALTQGYRVLNDSKYLDAANRAADFLVERMWTSRGLFHSYRKGTAGIDGLLDDYAYLIRGLIGLYQADFNNERIRQACMLADKMMELFEDKENGGFFSSPAGRKDLIQRKKQAYDAAMPSGNSFAAVSLFHLYQLTQNEEYRRASEGTLKAFSPYIHQSPAGHLRLASLISEVLKTSRQIAVLNPRDNFAANEFLKFLNSQYLPGLVQASGTENEDDNPTILKDRELLGGNTTAYYCHDFVCESPVTAVSELKHLMNDSGFPTAATDIPSEG